MKLFGRSTLKTRVIATIALAAVLIAGGQRAHGGKKNADGGQAAGSPSPAKPKFDIPIPVSHDAQSVQLPYFDNHGKLQMFFSIKEALRTDLNHLAMQDAFMQTYDEKGESDADVYMTRSVLDLNTRIVTSDVPVTVRRSDFEIVGQKMVFNTQTRIGHMSGHVRMIIYNHQEMSQTSSSPSPSPVLSSAAPHPGATP